MAPKNVARASQSRKAPTVIGVFPSKLLHDCPRCGRPVFSCYTATGGPVPVEVLEKPVGDVAIQTQIGGDELTAIVVTGPRTWYRFHLPNCGRAFSGTQLRKVRP